MPSLEANYDEQWRSSLDLRRPCESHCGIADNLATISRKSPQNLAGTRRRPLDLFAASISPYRRGRR
ncbi:MAG: hypothetical protein AAF974_06865 [Cyanobacteria bacterium P01_E01_bin.34]